MTNGTNDAGAVPRCWSCSGEVAAADAFCRHCGVKLMYTASGAPDGTQQQPISPTAHLHARLDSIEKLLLKTTIGVIALLLLVGWVALQAHHFGRD